MVVKNVPVRSRLRPRSRPSASPVSASALHDKLPILVLHSWITENSVKIPFLPFMEFCTKVPSHSFLVHVVGVFDQGGLDPGLSGDCAFVTRDAT